ncbi:MULTISPECIES: glycerol-3-phosphate responsive antiterminator [unclassified Thermosipho (in: thermotogales)]|uniref:glycerol-3-phosphate responsive antiterminator n=1 Tax=unclassified Thermosipho (in: thermotogales) TaxID=2676525 RepID=UPI000986CC99|nr:MULTISPECIES: glycerol-3-phosphate responsive antiterminator [unclassified Thermosipho (in: thermotogales)]MBT1247311.1 antiterminator [Thermosipho sp. 1244]OOC47029.1 antiterminator [Thermosipho sp. 1223]
MHPFVYPIVPAIRDLRAVERIIPTPVSSVFLLEGDIFKIKNATKILKESGKIVFVHLDLVSGLGRDEASVKLVKEFVGADGIITTRSNLIVIASKLGLMTVQRIFLIDSKAVETGIQQIKKHKVNFVEVLPGLIPEFIKYIKENIEQPIISGGLVSKKNQVKKILDAGAIAVSTSKEELWDMF